MFNTPEFWLLITFIICMLIAFKFILPSVKEYIFSYQTSVSKIFSDAELTLQNAEKKFFLAKERLDKLSELADIMNHELDIKINHELNRWQIEKETLSKRYKAIEDHTKTHLKNSLEHQTYDRLIQSIANTLEAYLKQSLTPDLNNKILLKRIQHLPKIPN